MTEAEWALSRDPVGMLRVVQQCKPSERKVRLFNAAICRRFWRHLPQASQAILSESELLADGLVPRRSEDSDLCWMANAVVGSLERRHLTKWFARASWRMQRKAAAAVCYAVCPDDLWGAMGYLWEIDPNEKGHHADVIRDVFGNPFRPMAIDPSWVSAAGGLVVRLAGTIYHERAFERLLILADALEEAGCTNPEILSHCRSGGDHVRGCWLVDLILSKDR
jgi:hypothetical protein